MINLTEKILFLMHRITSRAAIGAKSKYERGYISLLNDTIKFNGAFDLHDLYPSLKFLGFLSRKRGELLKLNRRMDEILDDVLNEHKMRSSSIGAPPAGKDVQAGFHGHDILDVLLNLQEADELEFDITSKHI